MKKAFSQITIKSFDEAEGIIEGIASTPTVDKVGDIVEPMGARFTLPLPLHHEHDRKDVVGEVFEAKPTPEGIEFKARIAKDVSAQIAEVWRRVQAGLIRFVSVGFRATKYEPIAKGGYRFTEWVWDELSLTTIPANPDAAIAATKAVQPCISITLQEGKTQVNISQQIASFEAKRTETLAKMDALIVKGVTLQGEDETTFKAHEAEIAEIDKHLARLKEAEARQAKSAAPVIAAHISVEDNAPKGTDFIRFVKAVALSNGNPAQALEVAKGLKYGNRVENVLKAAIAAGTTTSADFTALVEPRMMTSEFIELLRPATIVGKLSQVRHTPANIKIPKQTTGTSVNWIGEGAPAPITNSAYADLEVGDHKVGAIAVFTEELLRRSDPAVDSMVQTDLSAAIVNAVDIAFIDSANAGLAGVKPASITNGAASAAASGANAAAVRADVKAAKKAAIAANQSLASGAWIMHPVTALSLESMVNGTTGIREFPLINSVDGGYFEGLPVVLSTNVPGDDTAGYSVVLVVQGEILLAEGGLSIDVSREASLQMDTAPTNDAKTPTATPVVSLWQTGAIGIKAIRGITWTRRRPTAVYRISAAKYA